MSKKFTVWVVRTLHRQTLEAEDEEDEEEEEEEEEDDVMGDDDVTSFSSPYWIMLKLSGLVM